eukprot:COSAG02_NODE_9048_length_2350_cov_24.346068_3_plen_207_part_00
MERRLLQLCRHISAAPTAPAPSVAVLEAEASYELLGVAPLINAQGHITTLGGSRMPEAVVEAMVRASQSFVHLNELHQKAGAHIARLVGAPAAFVCDGAASGMFLAGCAVLAGADTTRIRALPTVSSGRTEFVISQVDGWHVRVCRSYESLNWISRDARCEFAECLVMSDQLCVLYLPSGNNRAGLPSRWWSPGENRDRRSQPNPS